MDLDDEKELQRMWEEYLKEQLPIVKQRCIEIFRRAIDENIYKYYDPHGENYYHRTYRLLDTIDAKLNNDGSLLVYCDTDNMPDYWSAVDGRDIPGENVAYWVQWGHDDDSPLINQYHHYTPRNFLQRAQELIQNEYPELDVKIISDTPPLV